MKKKTQVLFIVTSLVLTSLGCKKSSSNSSTSTPGTNEVWIQNSAFSPNSLTVPVNTTITWTNKDAMTHTVTSTTAAFDSGNINSGGVYSHTFTTSGSYAYKCSIHPSMTATIVVQ